MKIHILQARAARTWGVPPEAFDLLTPVELSEIARDWRKEWIHLQKVEDRRAAQVCLVIAQAHGAKQVKLDDFMVEYEGESESEPAGQDEFEAKRKQVISKVHNVMAGIMFRMAGKHGG